MIDTYFDRADAATGYRPTPSRPVWDDPRFYNGQLYATLTDRNVAEARHRLAGALDRDHTHHRWEIQLRIKLGHPASIFNKNGTSK